LIINPPTVPPPVSVCEAPFKITDCVLGEIVPDNVAPAVVLAVLPKVIDEPESTRFPVVDTASAVVIVPERVKPANVCEAEVNVLEVPFIVKTFVEEALKEPPVKLTLPETVQAPGPLNIISLPPPPPV
jgi:hypothetical protein